MKRNVITRSHITWLIFWLILILIFVSQPMLLAHVYCKNAAQDARVIRGTQLLLEMDGLYTGPIDGQYNAPTQQGIELAIQNHKGTHTNSQPSAAGCKARFLENLTDRGIITLIGSPHTNKSEPGDVPPQSVTEPGAVSNIRADLTKRIGDLTKSMDSEVKQLDHEVRSINDGLSAQFVTLSSNMNNMWVTTLVTGLGIFTAIAIAVINIFLKKKVDDLHEEIQRKHNELLAASTTKLSEMIADSSAKLSDKISDSHEDISEKVYDLLAKIYTQFAGHSFNLYKDLRDPAGDNNKLYNSYLNIAVTMAKEGYDNSVAMQHLLSKKKAGPSKSQKDVINTCLNNYVLYFSSRGQQEDNKLVAQTLPELEKIISEGQINDRWYDYIDTLAWAELHLNRKTAQEIEAIIQQLIADKAVPDWWKRAVKERYDFYNKLHSDKDGVNLQL